MGQKAFLWLMFILLAACGGREEERTFHANGNIKHRLPKKNGKLDGTIEEYYSSGKIKYRGQWSEGVSNGVIEKYFENGHLQSRQFYTYGKPDGQELSYFENGNLSFSATYVDGKMTGVSSAYYNNGIIEERTTYDTLGNVIHNALFSSEGRRMRSYMLPQVTLFKDTLWPGEEAVVSIRFPMVAKGSISISGFEKGLGEDPQSEGSGQGSPQQNQEILRLGRVALCTAADTVIFVRRYYAPGTYEITLRFDHTRIVRGDTLTVQGVKKSYTIFVRGRSVGL
jgi:hypothetical protein